MFLLEFRLGVLLPVALLAFPRIRNHEGGLVLGAYLTVLGFIVNRLNVSITGMGHAAGVTYNPSWMESAISLALMTGGFALFGLAVRYLPIFVDPWQPPPPREAPAWLLPTRILSS